MGERKKYTGVYVKTVPFVKQSQINNKPTSLIIGIISISPGEFI
jgi:hypothetical protein